MAPQPAPGTGAAPTGNALNDADIGAGLSGGQAQLAAVLNNIAQQQTDTASDCLWPTSAKITIPITLPLPLIHYSQTFQVPCLISYGEARAVIAAGLIVGGVVIGFAGIQIMVVAAVAPVALSALGLRAGIRSIVRPPPAKKGKAPPAPIDVPDYSDAT
jgi:hypothetical protein